MCGGDGPGQRTREDSDAWRKRGGGTRREERMESAAARSRSSRSAAGASANLARPVVVKDSSAAALEHLPVRRARRGRLRIVLFTRGNRALQDPSEVYCGPHRVIQLAQWPRSDMILVYQIYSTKSYATSDMISLYQYI